MGLAESKTVSRTLHHVAGGLHDGNCNSVSKNEIDMILATKRAKLLYWATMLDGSNRLLLGLPGDKVWTKEHKSLTLNDDHRDQKPSQHHKGPLK